MLGFHILEARFQTVYGMSPQNAVKSAKLAQLFYVLHTTSPTDVPPKIKIGLTESEEFEDSWNTAMHKLEKYIETTMISAENDEKIASKTFTAIQECDKIWSDHMESKPLRPVTITVAKKTIDAFEHDQGHRMSCCLQHLLPCQRMNGERLIEEINRCLAMALGTVTGIHPYVLNEQFRKAARERLLAIAACAFNGEQKDQSILTEIDLLLTIAERGDLVDAQILWYISLPSLRNFNVNVVVLGEKGVFSLRRFLGLGSSVQEVSIFLRHDHFVKLQVEQGVQALLETFPSMECFVQGGGACQ